jgi:ABC-type uncharacterized transport system permease subunit
VSWRQSLASAGRSLLALVVAIVLASIAFEAGGFSASGTLKGVVSGAVTGSGSFESTVRYAIPLAFIAIGVVVSFRGGFFNAGAQGQFYVGGIVALCVALFAPASLGQVTVSVLAILAGALAGTLWSVLPGLLRVYFDVNEVIGTLMFSFIAQYLVTWISVGPLKSPAGAGEVAVTRSVPAGVRVTGASGVDAGVLVGVALVAVVTWWLLRRTRFGFGVMLVGRNPVMAEVQGVDMAKTGLATFAITGFTAGLAGAIEILGPLGSISSGYDANVGFTAILVALVGVLAVGGSLVAALLFGGLTAAGVYLPIATGLPSTALLFFTGLISFLVTARLGFGRWPKGMAERLRRGPSRPPGADSGPGIGGSQVEPAEVTT